jgi:hypothetical protein
MAKDVVDVAPRRPRWAIHLGDFGRRHRAVDLKAKRADVPLYQLLGGFIPRVSCYAEGIDLRLTLDVLLQQTKDNLGKGFRAIKMKVGRPKLSKALRALSPRALTLARTFPPWPI